MSGMWLGTFAESAPLWMHSLLASALCLMVRSDLPAHSYELVALSFSAVLLSIPMLGEFGSVLRTDPAREWVEALPVRPIEGTVARVALLLASVGLLSLAALLPAAIFAPSEFGIVGRLALVLTGLAQAASLAALLLAVQTFMRGALEGLLVLLQTLLVAGAIVGTIAGLRFMPELREIALDDARLTFYPPAWFVSADLRMWAVIACSVVVLIFAPAPKRQAASNRKSLSDRLLAPLRFAASRLWVRHEERSAFDLVYDVLPREREFVIRTYPMLGIPLAFLLLGARGETGAERDIMMAVLLFTPAAYMPVLLTHVPASRTPDASWILKTAPISKSAIANGALKAVAIRFIFPLYILLSAVSVAFSGVEFTLRLAIPGALVSLLVMRRLFPSCATTTPLSRDLSDLEHDQDLMKSMFGQAVVLPILGIVVWKFAVTPGQVAGLIGVLLAIEWIHDRFLRESLVVPTHGNPS